MRGTSHIGNVPIGGKYRNYCQTLDIYFDEIKPFSKDIIMLLIQCYTTQTHSSTLELGRQFFVM